MPEMSFSPAQMAAIVAIVIAGGLAHGTIGLGFPVISTPLVTLLTDVKIAVLITVVPNIAVNLISIVRGGRWRASIGRHWPVALCTALGTLGGTRLLLHAPPEPLQILLAVMIFVYLLQDRLQRASWSWVARSPRATGIGVGLLGGVLSGAVKVSAPPLIIYFMTLELDPVAMTQVLNLCFIAGKTTQAASLGLQISGASGVLVASLPLTVISVAAVLAGMRLQARLGPSAYRRVLRLTLFAMALLLLMQVAWRLAARARHA